MEDQENKTINTDSELSDGAAVEAEQVSSGKPAAPEQTAAAEETFDQTSLFDESDDRLMAAVEAILFTMADSVEVASIAKALDLRQSRVNQIIDLLAKKYDSPSSGVMIQRFDSAVQMSTRPEQYENLIKIAKVPRKMQLSDSVIETLSIIAYKQPITKAEVEAIRGVSSDYAINKLLEYDLIKELGRKDAPGRPILFGTTEQFLRSFGVKNLQELPALNTVKEEEFKEEAEQEVDERLGV